MEKTPQYYIVEASALPEIFRKVAEAKRMLETGETDKVNEAAKAVGISRSAFYKYRDMIAPFQNMMAGRIITFQLMLKHKAGILSEILSIFANFGANILTINQAIPSGGRAMVTVSAETGNLGCSLEEFTQQLGDSSYLDMQAAKENIEKKKEALAKLTANADELEVKAKVGGVVASIEVTAGNSIGPDTPLAKLNVADRGYTIKISVTAEQAKRVKVGDKADVVNYWGGNVEAVLENIARDPNTSGNNLLVFKLTGDVDPNTNLTLSIGQKSASYDALVPNSAVRTDNNGTFVLALTSKSTPLSTRYTATRVPVQVLAQDDTMSAISGIGAGEFVITTSTKPIEAGTQVKLADNG